MIDLLGGIDRLRRHTCRPGWPMGMAVVGAPVSLSSLQLCQDGISDAEQKPRGTMNTKGGNCWAGECMRMRVVAYKYYSCKCEQFRLATNGPRGPTWDGRRDSCLRRAVGKFKLTTEPCGRKKKYDRLMPGAPKNKATKNRMDRVGRRPQFRPKAPRSGATALMARE